MAAPTKAKAAPATIIQWQGRTHIAGVYLASRVHVTYLNVTCTKLKHDLQVAAQVADLLTQTNLRGVNVHQAKRYGYLFLKLEESYQITLDYVTALLFCSGRGGELWQGFAQFKSKSSLVWQLLKRHGYTKNFPTNNSQFPNRKRHNTNNETTNSSQNESLITMLEKARPQGIRQPRSPILIGLGLGFLGSYLLGNIFGNDNDDKINELNDNIHKNNKQIRVTNQRIDILAKNVSDSVDTIKTILDKMVELKQDSNIHYAIEWNIDQLLESITTIRDTFKFGELTITLLNQGVINADLIDLKSFKKIIAEGLKAFPEMEFPLETTRYQLNHIIKILKIQRVGHLKFMMIIPLTKKNRYTISSLIPHPVKLDKHHLVLPTLRKIILIDNNTYITTDVENVYSISLTQHMLLNMEPIYKKRRQSCEYEAYKGNGNTMLEVCNYRKVGVTNDTFVVETDQHRLVHFSEKTRVSLDCPDKQVRDTLEGLHKVPLACDITTETVFWPAKQTLTIDIKVEDIDELDSTSLPLININKTTKVGKSLKELIDKLPDKNESFTIDFAYYDLTLKEVQSYSVYAHSVTILILILNSILIGYLLWKKLSLNRHRPEGQSFFRSKFNKVRDSLRSGRAHLRDSRNKMRSHSREIRRSLVLHKNKLRDSLRRGSRSEQTEYTDTKSEPDNEKSTHQEQLNTSPGGITIGTNTEDTWKPPPYAPKIYPMISRY